MPKFTKKHYMILAKAIAEVPVTGAGAATHKARMLAALFVPLHQDNPRFNGAKFLAACGSCEPRDPFDACLPLEVPDEQ